MYGDSVGNNGFMVIMLVIMVEEVKKRGEGFCPLCNQTLCLHLEVLYFLKYQEHSEYFTPFWLATVLNECELEFVFRKIRNTRNLSNFTLSSPPIVMSRTDVQNGLKPLFNDSDKEKMSVKVIRMLWVQLLLLNGGYSSA